MDIRIMLEQIKAYKGIKTDISLAEKLGITRQTVNKWVNTGNWNCEVILKAYPELNTIWVTTGKGDMLNPNITILTPVESEFDKEYLRAKLQEVRRQLKQLMKANTELNAMIIALEKQLDEE